MRSILDKLRILVERDNRERQAIAELAGIHPNTFRAFMAGRRGLSLHGAERLAQALGRPLQFAPKVN